jgi:phosphotransferase system enzyme I (PtsI)
MAEGIIWGLSLSRGIAHGTAYVLVTAAEGAGPMLAIAEPDIPSEIERLKGALAGALTQLSAIQSDVQKTNGADAAEMFDAQVLILQDPSFLEKMTNLIRARRINAEAALADVIDKHSRAMSKVRDEYLRERGADIRDLGRRILALLIQQQGTDALVIPDGSVVVVDELLPSVTASLDTRKVRAFVTERGGRTSHAAILARTNGTPAVSGIKGAQSEIKTGDYVVVDAIAGAVIVNPKPSVIRDYDKVEAEFQAYRTSLTSLLDLPSCTKDGATVTLLANIGKIADAEAAVLFKAEGVGLYRTEFTFMIRPTLPSEDEQYNVWKKAAERLQPRPVAFRVLDLGADKNLPFLPQSRAANPSLSKRGIRLMLAHPEILRTQFRALLRLSATHPISILLPMVGSVEEAEAGRRVLDEAKDQLRREGRQFNPDVRLGAMIETPAASLIVCRLAQVVDFFSLGTNDLIQYLLAADREDPEMESYYDPLHPAVLATLYRLVNDARTAGKEISICGDMAGDPLYTQLLLGLGLRSFSVAPGEILELKKAVRSVDLSEAVKLAERALECGTIFEVSALIKPQTDKAKTDKGRPAPY